MGAEDVAPGSRPRTTEDGAADVAGPGAASGCPARASDRWRGAGEGHERNHDRHFAGRGSCGHVEHDKCPDHNPPGAPDVDARGHDRSGCYYARAIVECILDDGGAHRPDSYEPR